MARLWKFLRVLKFANPRRSDVTVFDKAQYDMIQRIILHDIDHTGLPVRNELNYISIRVLAFAIKNLLKIAVREKKGIRALGLWQEIYLLSCVECISPKVVLTFIDNSSSFQWLSRHYHKKATFYAIQNATRIASAMVDEHNAPRHSMPHFMCFGRFEEDLYAKCNCEVDNFYPVGSLKGGYYKYKLCKGLSVVPDYHICLVSQFRKEVVYGRKDPRFKRALSILHTFLKKYIDERSSMTVNIACASSRGIEENYFEMSFGDRVRIIKHVPCEFTTYRYMDRSDVIIGLSSTAGFEAFGWGKKVLLCNFVGKELSSLFSSLPDICTVDIPDYNIFRGKLEYLMELDDLAYRKMTEKSAKYLMNYDPQMPAHRFIRDKIFEKVR